MNTLPAKRYPAGRFLCLAVSTLVLAACGGADEATSPTTAASTTTSSPSATSAPPSTSPTPTAAACASGVEFDLVAVDDEFDVSCLIVPAETTIVIHFDNQDDLISHNVVIRPSDKLTPLFEGELIQGPAQITYTIDPLPIDDYRFFCERHPTRMVVDFTVE